MKLEELKTLEDLRAFREDTQSVVFEVVGTKTERYQLIA